MAKTFSLDVFETEETGPRFNFLNFELDKAYGELKTDFLRFFAAKEDRNYNSPHDLVENFILFSAKTFGSFYISGVCAESLKKIYKLVEPITLKINNDQCFGIYKNSVFVSIFSRGSAWDIKVFGDAHILEENVLDLQKLVKKEKVGSKFKILTSEYNELSFSECSIQTPKLNIELAYGKEFVGHHEKIMEYLETKTAGVYIFRGEPGTGKSTYIKYLSSKLKKPLLYIPESLCDRLSSPDMLPLLMRHKGSVLVLEDAERAVAQRDGGYSPVSTLLNLSDGVLGDLLDISIIVSFNTKTENVDSALIRKGRCHYEVEFKRLEVEDAKKLAKSLGKDESLIDEPKTVGQIHNLESSNNVKDKKEEKKFMGFGT